MITWVKKNLTISTVILILNKSVIKTIIIGADANCVACKLRKAQIFAVSMRNLELQVVKEAKL